MRTLICGTSYVQGLAGCEVLQMWRDLTVRLNPGVDILVVDSASPFRMVKGADFDLIRFEDNLGHLFHGGRDGWGRAFTHGVLYAIDKEYDWLALLDCDLLLARPVGEILGKMIRSGVRAAAPMAIPYQFTETACSFWS